MSVPSLVGVKPCGSLVLVEKLTQNELLGTKIHIPGATDSDVIQQGYILSHGPALDPEKYGFKIGDRVMLVGKGANPLPKIEEERDRELNLVEPTVIRCVLEEAAPACTCTETCNATEAETEEAPTVDE